MKQRGVLVVLLLALFLPLFAEDPVGSIDFTDGPFTISREGALLPNPAIGDSIYDQDLIATGSGGTVTIALAKATGMTGTVKVGPSSSFYLELDGAAGAQHSQVELVSGAIGLKVKKISGTPSLAVATDTAVMGVRGTEFEVATSAGGNLLVTCTDGEVACTDENGSTVSAVPGQTVEKREGQKMERRALALVEYQKFKETWLADETAAFKRNAPRVAGQLALRYLELLSRFQAVHEELASNGVLKGWLQDEKAGRAVPGPELASQLAQVGPRLRDARKILVAMMRLSARVRALDELVRDDRGAMAASVRKGLTVGQFFARFRAQAKDNLQRQTWLMHALKLYRRQLAEARRLGAEATPNPAAAPGAAAQAAPAPGAAPQPAQTPGPGSAPESGPGAPGQTAPSQSPAPASP